MAAASSCALLARRGAQAVLKMIVEDGFFHADPHPGDLVYLPATKSRSSTSAWSADSPARGAKKSSTCCSGWSNATAGRRDALLDRAANARGVDVEELEIEIEAFVDQYRETPLATLRLGDMLEDATRLLREHPLALPADLRC